MVFCGRACEASDSVTFAGKVGINVIFVTVGFGTELFTDGHVNIITLSKVVRIGSKIRTEKSVPRTSPTKNPYHGPDILRTAGPDNPDLEHYH